MSDNIINEKDLKGRTPAQERAEIGTPAGEPPGEGAKRHGTKQLRRDTDPMNRGEIDYKDEDEEYVDEIGMEGEEISTTGGITGTHVEDAIPSGGAAGGGTQPERHGKRSGDYKK